MGYSEQHTLIAMASEEDTSAFFKVRKGGMEGEGSYSFRHGLEGEG